jgi:hypothetical protein
MPESHTMVHRRAAASGNGYHTRLNRSIPCSRRMRHRRWGTGRRADDAAGKVKNGLSIRGRKPLDQLQTALTSLAAARVSGRSPVRILEQVSADRLDFLGTRRRDAASRQRTLRATLDWSYLLLPAAGRQFLPKLSVFRGGWTLEAARAVCKTDEETDFRALAAAARGVLTPNCLAPDLVTPRALSQHQPAESPPARWAC